MNQVQFGRLAVFRGRFSAPNRRHALTLSLSIRPMNRAALPIGLLLCAALTAVGQGQRDAGRLEITVSDPATRRPAAFRIHLKDASGRLQRAPGLPFWRDHFGLVGLVRLHPEAGEGRVHVLGQPVGKGHEGQPFS